jgi:hypothetical protein
MARERLGLRGRREAESPVCVRRPGVHESRESMARSADSTERAPDRSFPRFSWNSGSPPNIDAVPTALAICLVTELVG